MVPERLVTTPHLYIERLGAPGEREQRLQKLPWLQRKRGAATSRGGMGQE